MNPQLFHITDYRGATVEDLDIRPAISINPSTPYSRAFQIAFENEFAYLPVIQESNKKLLGVLNVFQHKIPSKTGPDSKEPLVKDYMTWFHQKAKKRYEEAAKSGSKTSEGTPLNSKIIKPSSSSGKNYEVLTPMSPLEDLAKFFNSGNYFAIITTGEGNLVYGVVTPEDLSKYEQARPKL